MGDQARDSVVEKGHAALFNLVRDAVFVHPLPPSPAELTAVPLIDANDAACRMLGYSREELLTLTVGDIDRSDSGPIPGEQIAAMRDGGHLCAERLAVTKDGRLIPVEVQSDLVEIDGETYALSSIRDISERRQFERDLSRQRELTEHILEAAPTGVVRVDRSGRITFANHQAQQCLHLRPNDERTYDAPEWDISDFDGQPFPPDELPFARVRRTEEAVFGVEHAITVDGVRVLLSINAVPLFDAGGEFDGIVATVADVGSQVRTSRALENSERYLRDVIDAIQDGISVLDRDLVITRANRTMERWYPHALPLVGKRCHEAFHGQDVPCNPCPSQRALESGQLESNTVPYRSPSGVRGWIDVHAFPLRDAGGRAIGVVEYVQDVTAQRHVQYLIGLQRDLAASLSGVDDFDEAQNALLDAIAGVPGIDAVTLALRRPDGSSHLVGGRGLGDVVGGEQPSLPSDHPLVQTLNRRDAIYLDATQLGVELGDAVDRLLTELRAVGIVPVTHEGKVIGSVTIASRTRREFDPSVRSAIETIASQVGGALGRIRAQTELKRYAETQTVLLREVNHRVKNNLAAIISILHKEQDRAEATGHQSYLGLLREMVARVTSLATVHRLLSESQWQPLPIEDLCRGVVEAVVRGHKSPERVVVEIASSEVTIVSDAAHHVALVLNELATNCLKYGLAGRESLTIRIDSREIHGEVAIRVADDGPGFPASVLAGDQTGGLGLELVQGIVRRTLRGSVQLGNHSGAVVELRFAGTGGGGTA